MEKKDLDGQETVEIQKKLHRQSQGTSFLRDRLCNNSNTHIEFLIFFRVDRFQQHRWHYYK